MNVENFLTIVHEIQSEEKHRTISIVQLIVLLELFKAKGKPVSLLDIQFGLTSHSYLQNHYRF